MLYTGTVRRLCRGFSENLPPPSPYLSGSSSGIMKRLKDHRVRGRGGGVRGSGWRRRGRGGEGEGEWMEEEREGNSEWGKLNLLSSEPSRIVRKFQES